MSTPLHARPDAYEAVAFLDPISGSFARSLVVPGALRVEPGREYFTRGQADQVPETSSLVLSFEDVDSRNHDALDAFRHAECPVVAVAVGPFGVLQWYDATSLDAIPSSYQGLHSRRVVAANRRVRPAVYEGDNLCGFAGWHGLQPVAGAGDGEFYQGLWRINRTGTVDPVFDGTVIALGAGSAGSTVTLDRIWFPFDGSRVVLAADTFNGSATQRLSAHDAEGNELASAQASRPGSSADLALTLPAGTAYLRVRITLNAQNGRVRQPVLRVASLGPVAGRRVGPVLGGGLGFPAPFIPSGPGGGGTVGDFFTKAESDARYVNVTGDVMLGDLTLEQNLYVDGWADLRANVDIGGTLRLDGNLLADANASIAGALDVGGIGDFASHVYALSFRRERLGDDAALEWHETTRTWRAGLAGATVPIAVRNRVLQRDLDADLWDGREFADYLNQPVRTDDRPSWQGATLTTYDLTVPANRGVMALGQALRFGSAGEELLRLDKTVPDKSNPLVRIGLGLADGWLGRAGGTALGTLTVASAHTTLAGHALVEGRFGLGRINANFRATLDGDVAFTGYLGTEAFASGFLGHGWSIRQEEGRWSGELDNLTVRGILRVYELLIQRIRAAGGSFWFTDVGRPTVVRRLTDPGLEDFYELTFDTEGGEFGHEFTEGDLILAQRWRWDSTSTYRSECQVWQVDGPDHALVRRLGGEPPEAGAEFVRVGSATRADRRGSLYITASDSGAPFMDVLDGVASFADLAGPDKLKARHGKLTGIVDPVLGALGGYGLFTQRAYLRAGNDFLVFDGSLRLETPNLKIDAAGNVTMAGRVTATAGTIAGWKIETTGLTKVPDLFPAPATAVGLLAGTAGTSYAMFAGATSATGTAAKFFVRNDGFLRAENAYIAGEIRAGSGLIGGLTIAQNRLFKTQDGYTFAVDGAIGASVLTHDASGHTLARVGAGTPAPNPPVQVSNDNSGRDFDNWVTSDTLYSDPITLAQGPVDVAACRTLLFQASVTVNDTNTGTVRPDGTFGLPYAGYFRLQVDYQAFIDGGWRVKTEIYDFVVPRWEPPGAKANPVAVSKALEVPFVTWGLHTPQRATRIAQVRLLGSPGPVPNPPSPYWKPEFNLTVEGVDLKAYRPSAFVTPGGVTVYAAPGVVVELGAGRARFSGDVTVGGALGLGRGELLELEGALFWRNPRGDLIRVTA